MPGVKILGTGSAFGERVMPNSEFEKYLDTSDEWITSRTGIRERRLTGPGQGLSHLAIPASRQALEMAGVSPKDLDLIIVATASPDMYFPSTACLVQHGLGARDIPAFDMNAACPGFIYGVTVARKFMVDLSHKHVLVVGGEVPSMYMDLNNRSTAVLFGDGAGAAVLGPAGPDEEDCVLSSAIKADGSLWELLHAKGGGSRMPLSQEVLDNGHQFVTMNGKEVFRHAVRCMVDVSHQVLVEAGKTIDDIDWFIPHQANLRIIDAVGKRLAVDPAKVIEIVHKYGNTSAAAIPTALDEKARAGIIKRGDLILSASFGAGFTWGGMLYRF